MMLPLTYTRAGDVAAASRAARADGAQLVAGGTTMLDLMKLGVIAPTTLVDVNDLAHAGIRTDGGVLRLGALVRMADAAEHPVVRQEFPVIADSLRLAASQQIRNMATLGGNVLQRTRCSYFRDTRWTACNKRTPGSGCAALEGNTRTHAVLGISRACIATYPGDFAQALIALDAQVELRTDRGRRTVPFAKLHRGPDRPEQETVLARGEIITEFVVPRGPWTRRSVYVKVRDRQSYEFALAGAAVALDLDGARVRTARIALGGVAYRPWRSTEAETVLQGRVLDERSATDAARAAFATARATGDNAYKPELGRRTLVRALLHAKAMR